MCRILVADDDSDQLRLYQMLLESAGHEVALAPDAAEAFQQLDRGWAEVIVMDLRFPEAHVGLALIRRIRARGLKPPVIVLSGWPNDLYGQPEEAMVSLILVKPVPPVKLFAAIRRLTAA